MRHRPDRWDALRLGAALSVLPERALAQTAPECPPSALTELAAGAPRRWVEAAAVLDRELGLSDRPWSCAGAVVTLDVQSRGPSIVEVRMPDGLLLCRHLDHATELLPTVEGMLTVGQASRSAVTPPVLPPAPAPERLTVDEHELPPPAPMGTSARSIEPTPRAGPVVIDVDGEFVYRIAGGPLHSTPGVSLGGGVRLGHVGVTTRLQYETLSAGWSESPGGFSIDSWTVALGVGWLIPLHHGELSAGPTVAIRGSAITADDGAAQTDDEIAQARVGLDLHWRSRTEGLALLLGARADLSAGSLFGSGRDYNVALPPPPMWGAEVSVGFTYGARP